MSKNKLADLDGFPCMPALETLDLGENSIKENGEGALVCLKEQENLKTLLMSGNEWVDEKGDDFKKEVLIALDMLKIKYVNDLENEVTEEDRQEAKNEKIEREKARIEAEEEARRAAEEAKNNPEGEEAE